ncbi:MAG: methyltransferase [Acidobacteriota bacterium]
MDSHAVQGPTPDRIFATFNAHQQTAALKAAIELDIFTAIADGQDTASALAGHAGASERGVRILCDFLTIMGFLSKDAQRYSLAPDSALFLSRHSPAYLGISSRFLASPHMVNQFSDLAAVVRKGGTIAEKDGSLAPDHPMWIDFARSMVPLIIPAAEFIPRLLEAERGEPWKVLDIAAGHGMFGIMLAQHNKNVQIVALDWPNVLTVARENARTAGLSDRYRTLEGSAFDLDFGSEYDVVLLTNFLHHFDIPTCENLLSRIHKHLADGGRVVTLEFVPDEDRVSPPIAAAFSMMMLGSTPAGDAYTFSQYQQMFESAGYSRTERHPIPNYPEEVLVSWK